MTVKAIKSAAMENNNNTDKDSKWKVQDDKHKNEKKTATGLHVNTVENPILQMELLEGKLISESLSATSSQEEGRNPSSSSSSFNGKPSSQTTTMQASVQHHESMEPPKGTAVKDIQELPDTCDSIDQARGRPGAHRIRNFLRTTSSRTTTGNAVRRQQEDSTSDPEEEIGVIILEGSLVMMGPEDDVLEPGLGRQSRKLEEATNVKPLQQPYLSKTVSWLWLILVVLVVGAIVIVLPIVLISPSSKSTPATPTNGGYHSSVPATTSSIDQPQELLQVPNQPFLNEGLTMAVLRAINETDSPFYWANQWVLQDPNLSSYTQEKQLQRFYLVVMYYATNGDSWHQNSNWLSYQVSECSWYFSTNSPVQQYVDFTYYQDDTTESGTRLKACNDKDQLVNFVLADNNLTGNLPVVNFEKFLPHLRIFDIGNNDIVSFFPMFPSGANLEAFSVANNDLHGGINVMDAVNLPQLRIILLNDNQLYKSVLGAAIQYLPSLQVMNIGNNLYQGQLPTHLGLLSRLTHIDFSNNVLVSGTIPSELGNIQNLTELQMAGLPLVHGTIPSELATLSKLTHFNIVGAMITGPIPEPLCRQVAIGKLSIVANCSLVECCPP